MALALGFAAALRKVVCWPSRRGPSRGGGRGRSLRSRRNALQTAHSSWPPRHRLARVQTRAHARKLQIQTAILRDGDSLIADLQIDEARARGGFQGRGSGRRDLFGDSRKIPLLRCGVAVDVAP